MIELKLDNQIIEAREGETVLEAALRNGIEIPHFCFHPCLSIAGNCRICLVQVNGRPKLMPACNLPVTPGMEIDTNSEPVRAARRAVMQFITLNHPVDCGICDKAGECRLQEYHMRYGDEPFAIEPKHHKPKFYDLSDRIVHDAERCILCSRCARFTREISGSFQLGIVERGSHSRVERLDNGRFDDPYSDNVISICPVGALLSRDFLYKSRVWYLEPVASVCPGCSRGCGINIWKRTHHWKVRGLGDEKNRMVYRVTPRDVPEINGPWICNKGFDLPKEYQKKPRAVRPLVGGSAVSLDDALSEAKRLLAKAVNPALIVSAWGSNEDLEACKAALGGKVSIYTRQDKAAEPGEIIEDQVLIKGDKNPNSAKVRELFGDTPYTKGNHDLIILWGDGISYPSLGGAGIIHLSSFEAVQSGTASVFLPISTFMEQSGSFTNFEGKVNCFVKVFDKPELVQHAGELFGRLA